MALTTEKLLDYLVGVPELDLFEVPVKAGQTIYAGAALELNGGYLENVAGAGTFARAYVTLTGGLHVGTGPDAAERVAEAWDRISDRADEVVPDDGSAQGRNEVGKAMASAQAVQGR